MTIKLYVVDECGTDLLAESIDSRVQEILGDSLDNYVEFRLHELRDRYPEARWIYREDEKTLGELRCEEYEARYQENLKWAEEHPDEIDDMDPEEWADEVTRDEMNREWW